MRNILTFLSAVLLYFTTAAPVFAQGDERNGQITIFGTIMDNVSKEVLPGAKVVIYDPEHKKTIGSVITDGRGGFEVKGSTRANTLELQVEHLGFAPFRRSVPLSGNKSSLELKELLLMPVTKSLNAVVVQGNIPSVADLSGKVKGRVKDSTYKVILSSATIAIYTLVDSNLLQFTIPNNFGEFAVSKLPVNIPLKMLVTHVGYSPYSKVFQLGPGKVLLDLDWIFMEQNAGKKNVLKEVQVTGYAPVRMNGDTLEFNPRAFKMDANATAEDLMRRLPGMVIWGDGDITFNGKKINSLLVDGKPFMGGSDLTAATQNLPKEVLDKVQIYSQRSEKNPLDSTLHANLKLKSDKKVGFFGKVGAGYGTRERIAADGMLSYYDKRLQVSGVGAYNNTNKSANNINTLIRSNSFKGDGSGIDYQSDFRRAGINVGTTAGIRLQYDVLPEVRYKKSQRVTLDQFFKQNNETINSSRTVNTTIRPDSILTNNSTSTVKNSSMTNALKAVYMQQERNLRATVSANADLGQNNITATNSGEQYRTGTVGPISRSTSFRSTATDYRTLMLDARLDFQKEVFDDDEGQRKKHLLSNFMLDYRYDHNDNKGDRQNISSIVAVTDASANRSFDRFYHTHDQKNVHSFELGYPGLKKMLFGFAGLGGMNIDLNMSVKLERDLADVLVLNMNNGAYIRDANLTNYRTEMVKDANLKLTFTKNFYSGLTNRYDKRLDILFSPGTQFYSRKSDATQNVQDFRYSYRTFIPVATITYNEHQYGNYELNSNLSYQRDAGYPNVDHIAPLVDSANIWFIPKGNINIRPEYRSVMKWKTSFESRGPIDPYQFDLSVDANMVSNKISDSTNYDELGRRINYNVNLNGYKNWHLGAHLRKSYSPNKRHTYRFDLWYDRYRYSVPQYQNAILMKSNNSEDDLSAEVTYSYLDIVDLNAKQGLSSYRNRQGDHGTQYKGANDYTRISGALQLPRGLTWSTDINFNRNTARDQPTINYAIWNASLTYRFLKGNRGEIKLAALDILKQNKSVVNTTNRNVQTFGLNSVLQQYFMIALSYYPRVFGK